MVLGCGEGGTPGGAAVGAGVRLSLGIPGVHLQTSHHSDIRKANDLELE